MFLAVIQGGQPRASLTRHAHVLALYACRQEPASVKACKQVVLDALVCDQFPRSKLAEAWLPPTRLWSATCQASSQAAHRAGMSGAL